MFIADTLLAWGALDAPATRMARLTRGHLSTLLRTTSTGFCARPTMLHVPVAIAFFRASITDRCAGIAEFGMKFTTSTHE